MKLRKFEPKSATANERERNRVAIIVAVIGAISVILAAIIAIIPDLLQESSVPTSFVMSPVITGTNTAHPNLILNETSIPTSQHQITPSFSGVCYYHNTDNNTSLAIALSRFSLSYDVSTSYYYCSDMKGIGCTGKIDIQNENAILPPDIWLAILGIKNSKDCDLGGGIIFSN